MGKPYAVPPRVFYGYNSPFLRLKLRRRYLGQAEITKTVRVSFWTKAALVELKKVNYFGQFVPSYSTN